jgi:hypothetical protein
MNGKAELKVRVSKVKHVPAVMEEAGQSGGTGKAVLYE